MAQIKKKLTRPKEIVLKLKNAYVSKVFNILAYILGAAFQITVKKLYISSHINGGERRSDWRECKVCWGSERCIWGVSVSLVDYVEDHSYVGNAAEKTKGGSDGVEIQVSKNELSSW